MITGNYKQFFVRFLPALLIVFIVSIMTLFTSVDAIGTNDFKYTIENGEVTIIGFSGSGDVIIPSKINGYPVTKIKDQSFSVNKTITSVVIPDSVKEIEYHAFSYCTSIVSVVIGNGVENIGSSAFNSCDSITDLKIGTNVKRIDSQAFNKCKSLIEVVIPDSVEKIGSHAFYGCTSLQSVKIGKGVNHIEEGAFGNTPILKELTIDSDNKSFVNIGSVLYNKDVTTLVFCPNSITEIDFPDTVTSIGSNALYCCDGITKLTIPESITSIGTCAIFWCPALTELVIPDSVIFVGDAACGGNKSLNSVKIGKGLTRISEAMFEYCTSLTNLTVPDNVTSIGKEAFQKCSSLTTVIIPTSVKEIGVDAFLGCKNLSDIYFEGTQDLWDSISVDASVPDKTVVHFGEAPPDEEPFVGFIDVKADAFYADAVSWAVQNGITSGTTKSKFSPDEGCTRGQVVTFLWRAAGRPIPKTIINPFDDVKVSDYYNNAVLWAVENNITKGTSGTKFSPTDVCTRGQIVTFLWRASGEPEPETDDNPFEDVVESDYFYNAVLWAVEEEITRGTSYRTFSPSEMCTRSQIVTFLFRNKT